MINACLFPVEKTPYSTSHVYLKTSKNNCEQLTYLVTLLWCLYAITDGYKNILNLRFGCVIPTLLMSDS